MSTVYNYSLILAGVKLFECFYYLLKLFKADLFVFTLADVYCSVCTHKSCHKVRKAQSDKSLTVFPYFLELTIVLTSIDINLKVIFKKIWPATLKNL